MYDIKKFLENRAELMSRINTLQFSNQVEGDSDSDEFECEIVINNTTLYIRAWVEETLTKFDLGSWDREPNIESERELDEIVEAYYVNSEDEKIPCTNSEIEIIENVIESLL